MVSAAKNSSCRFIPPTPDLRPPRVEPSAPNLTQGQATAKPVASDATNWGQTALRRDSLADAPPELAELLVSRPGYLDSALIRGCGILRPIPRQAPLSIAHRHPPHAPDRCTIGPLTGRRPTT